MRIGLIRHGETDWNAKGLLQGVSDIPLNALGRAQAEAAGRMLVGQGWDALFCSPLSRAVETAEILAREAGLPAPVPLEGVRERSFGELEGQPYMRPDGTRTDLDHPSVEPVGALLERSIAAIQAAALEDPGRAILIVCHGTVIRNVLDAYMDEEAPSIANLSLSVLVPGREQDFDVVIANGYPRFPLEELPLVAEAPDAFAPRGRAGHDDGHAETPDAAEPGRTS